jgi:hypothetical protein
MMQTNPGHPAGRHIMLDVAKAALLQQSALVNTASVGLMRKDCLAHVAPSAWRVAFA